MDETSQYEDDSPKQWSPKMGITRTKQSVQDFRAIDAALKSISAHPDVHARRTKVLGDHDGLRGGRPGRSVAALAVFTFADCHILSPNWLKDDNETS